MPSFQALPFVALLTYGIMIFVFEHPVRAVHANVIAGWLTAWTPILIVWGAIFLFQMMEATGAMTTLRHWLNTITHNRVAKLMMVGWAFPFLIEGASGFGTPAALAAPILVGLGFKPLPVAMMVLCMNSVPVSFGAVGTPTWFGFSEIPLTQDQIMIIGIQSAIIHGVASLIIPVLALRFLVSWQEIRDNVWFIYAVIACTMVPYVMVALWSYEFPALIGGLVGLLSSVLLARQGWGLQLNSGDNDFQNEKEKVNNVVKETALSKRDLLRASFPLWGTIVVLILTRVPQFGIKSWLTMSDPIAHIDWHGVGAFWLSSSLVVGMDAILGTSVTWRHQLLYVPSFMPFALIALIAASLFHLSKADLQQVFHRSVDQVKLPAVALFGALVFVKLMMMGQEGSAVNHIGQVLASGTGEAWYGFAAVLGAVGSFFSGSNTISNLTFGPIQYAIATDLGLDKTLVLALQSVGGAMGNMVCINNIVAVCSVLAITNKEGYILVRTVRIMIPYAIIAAITALVILAVSASL